MLRELESRIASRRREMLDLARELISIPSENPPGAAYGACARVLRAHLRKLGFHLDSGTPEFCVRSFYGAGPCTLYFHGHFDVVPAAARAQFEPVVKAGKLYGRGSSDMKSGLVSMIYAVRAIEECGLKLNGRIALSMVPDEETGGARGSEMLTNSLLDNNVAGMLTPEPTGGVIWNASRGAISLRVRLTGKAAHAGLAYAGRNAFEGMVALAERLLKLKAQVARQKTRFAIRPDAARNSILLLGGQCSGGTNFNVVPAECSFTIDRRTNPEEKLVAEKRRLMQVLESFKSDGIRVEVAELQQGEPSAR